MGSSGFPTRPSPNSHPRGRPLENPETFHQQPSIHILSGSLGSHRDTSPRPTTANTSVHTTMRQRPSNTCNQQGIRQTSTTQQPHRITLGLAQPPATHPNTQTSTKQSKHCRPVQPPRLHHSDNIGVDNTPSTNRTPRTHNEQNSGKSDIRPQTWIRPHTSHPGIPRSVSIERHSQFLYQRHDTTLCAP